MNRLKALFLAAAVLLFAGLVSAQNNFYMEVSKENRIYVFDNQKSYVEFQQTGDIEVKIVRVGAGPNGETMIFDSEEAIHLYNFKHNLPDEVIAKPAAPASAPAVQEKLPYHFSGLMFGDYLYVTAHDPNVTPLSNVALPLPKDYNAFQFRRIYFTFDDDLSTNFTTRFRLEADGTALTSTGKITVFVKDAWLKWKNVFGNNDLIFGIQPTSAYETTETLWTYRSLEKDIMDLRGIVASRDFGVSLRGRFDTAGKYSYWVEVGNNSNTSPEIDKYKRFYFNFQYQPNDKFTFMAYDDIKQNPFILSPINGVTHLGNDVNTFALFASYGNSTIYRLGFETFFQHTSNQDLIGGVVRPRNGIGYSAWGWYNFNPKVGVVGRYDYFDPDRDQLKVGDSRGLFIGSLVLKPLKNVWIMPNIEVEHYESLPTGVSFKNSVNPRLTFYFSF